MKGQVLQSKTLFPGVFCTRSNFPKDFFATAKKGLSKKGQAEGSLPWGFATAKGQLSMEVIGIAVVVLLLFLVVILVVFQKSLFTNEIASINQNTQQCNKIAAVIESFYSSQGYGETKLEMEEQTRIDPGSITVNPGGCPRCQYCRYYGDINHQLPITLDKGKYDVNMTDYGVKFTKTP